MRSLNDFLTSQNDRSWPTLLSIAALLSMLVAMLVQPLAALAVPVLGNTIENLGETTTVEDHLVRDVSDAVTYMDESAQVPLDQMLRRARQREPAKNIIIEWERVDRTPPRQDSITADSSGHASGATVTLDVNNADMWRPHDIADLPGNTTAPNLFVQDVNYGASTIDVKALPTQSSKTRSTQAFGTVPDVSSGDTIVRIANTKSESDDPSRSRLTQPVFHWNYIHTFDAVVKASDHRQRTENYTMDDWRRAQMDNLVDLRRSMEYNYFFGLPSITADPDDGKLRTTMGGLDHYVDQSLNYTISSGITEGEIIDWHSEIYTGNTGRDTRVLFADKDLAGELDKVMLSAMQHAPSRTVAGVEATELRTRHGRTLVVHHPGFDELGRSHYGFVVDLAAIQKAELQPLEKREQDLKESGGEDADQEQYIEKSTLEVTNPDVHYRIEGT